MDLMDNAEIYSLMEETEEIMFDSDTVYDETVEDYSKDVDEIVETIFGDDSLDNICEDVDLSDIENIKDGSNFDSLNTDDCEIIEEGDLTPKLHFVIPDKLERDSLKNRQIRDKSKWRKTIESLEKREARRGKRRQIPNCRCMCSQKMSDDEQLNVYNSFNDLETNDKQNMFLRQSIISKLPQRHRSRKGTDRRRRVFNYYVNSKDRKIPVCLSAFTAILGIKRSRLMRKVQSQNDERGVFDGRGKHGNQKRIDPSVKKSVKFFLEKLPTFGSRYIISEDKIQKYLHPELSVLTLHKYFVKHYANSITYQAFRGILRNQLKYSFCFARCISCKICHKSKVSLDSIEEELHVRRAHQFFEILRSYRNLDTFENLVICFGYQTDLPIPVTNTSSDYYMHHLKIHNFGIHNIVTNKTDMFMYSEHFARKEVDEVLSCLDHYIHRNWQKQIKKLIIFCDNWCNQTKNEFFFAYLDQLCALNVFEEVLVFYPISGHSSMPIHSKFESVEKNLMVRRTICSPEQYVEILKETKCDKPFSLNYVEHRMVPCDDEKIVKVLNWKAYYSHFINSPIGGIWNCRMAQFNKGNNPVIRSTYNGPDNELNLYKKGFSKMNYLKGGPPKKYSNFLPVTFAKLNDIKHLLEISGMSDWSKEFYSSISASLDAEDTNIDAYE